LRALTAEFDAIRTLMESEPGSGSAPPDRGSSALP
jgi:hypothetical protein